MKLVFISNYFNHHQKALCSVLQKECIEFNFISTSVMREERRKLGYIFEEPDYVIRGYEKENFEKAKVLIKNADIILYGGAQGKFQKASLYHGKTVFYYSERLFKKQPKKWQFIFKLIKYFFRFTYHQNSYLLCSGAYVATDFAKMHTFTDRYYRWGYFPITKHYNINDLIRHKNKKKILWCGRLLSWKHPETAIEIARRLRNDAIDFSMEIIGIGSCEEQIKDLIQKYCLNDCVTMVGAINHENVRLHMETAGIYIFTSDKQEGWGAVLNEAMNSGCAVVANYSIGSVPYLISDNTNGYIYKNNNIDSLYRKVLFLLSNENEQERIGIAAYETISKLWNADVAAQRFISLGNLAMNNKPVYTPNDTGPCSKAPLIYD